LSVSTATGMRSMDLWGWCGVSIPYCVCASQAADCSRASRSLCYRRLIREGCKLKPPSVPPHAARRRSDRTQRPPIRYKAPTNPACSKVTRLATPRPIKRCPIPGSVPYSPTDRLTSGAARRVEWRSDKAPTPARAAPNPRLQPMGHSCGRRHASLCHVRR
jgi:hypothetical protein